MIQVIQPTPAYGTIGSLRTGKGQEKRLSQVIVSPGPAYKGQAVIEIDVDGERNRYLTLAPKTVCDVVKALLNNLHPTTIATDDELLNIIKNAVGESEREAREIVDCIKRQQ